MKDYNLFNIRLIVLLILMIFSFNKNVSFYGLLYNSFKERKY